MTKSVKSDPVWGHTN